MELKWRFYRRPAQTVPALVGLALLIGIALLVDVSELGVHDHGSWIAVLAIAAVIVATGARTMWRIPRIGIDETEDGLVSRTDVRRDLVKWEDIEAFSVVQTPVWRVVRVVPRTGPPIALSLRQGRLIKWDGGETRDIASVLAERTNEVLRARGHASNVRVGATS